MNTTHPTHPTKGKAAAKLAPANTILGQVERQISNARQRLAMLMAPFLEGGGPTPLGSGGWGVGDNGNSHGAYQINLPYHPGVTAADATNPAFAVHYMSGAYRAAVREVPNALWQRDPVLAAEEAIQKAENPAESYYASHGASGVNMAYRDAVRAATGAPPATFYNTGGSTTGAAGGGGAGGGGAGGGATAVGFSAGDLLHIASPITLLPSLVGNKVTSSVVGWIAPLLVKGLFVMFGGGMVVLGGYVAASHTAPGKLAETAAMV